MDVRVKFLGGAQSVTGSKYLLEIDNFRLLVDCGLFQGLKELRLRNWNEFETDPATIDAVVLTHAHIDHSGYLPKLVREGFTGPVYCTEATGALLKIMLLDSAKLQEEEAAFALKKGYSKHENPQPLYNQKDVKQALELLKPAQFDQKQEVSSAISVQFFKGGHILGAAIVKIFIEGMHQKKEIVFSGDLGRYNNPMHEDPTPIPTADILFIESTYGNRSNQSKNPQAELAQVINQTVEQNGCLMIPAFSVGRTQLILYYLVKLFEEKSIPAIPVYLDSPMALSVTGIYRQFMDCHKLGQIDLDADQSLFNYPQFHYVREQEKSMALNNMKKNAIIISASGMCTGGRILHHLFHRLKNEKDTLLFVGYQGNGTRGRRILEGEKTIKIFGQQVPVNCHVRSIDGLSAHADRAELIQWARNFISTPKQTFVVHGEKDAAFDFAKTLKHEHQHHAIVPDYLESFELFKGI